MENEDGSWLIKTEGESGEYKLVYDVTDGELITKAQAEVMSTINQSLQPLNLTTKIEAEEGSKSRLSIRRIKIRELNK